MIAVGILGILLIGFAIYTIFAYFQQKKCGVKVKAVVTEIESIMVPFSNGNETREGYVATLEFDYNGQHYSRRALFQDNVEKNKTVFSRGYDSNDISVEYFDIHKLEIGEVVDAIYIDKGQKYRMSVSGLGFDKSSVIFGVGFELLVGIPLFFAFFVEFGIIDIMTYGFIWLIAIILAFMFGLYAKVYKKNNPDSSMLVSTRFDDKVGKGKINSSLTRYDSRNKESKNDENKL